MEHGGWKHCLEIEHDGRRLIVATEVGPRILSWWHADLPKLLKLFDADSRYPDLGCNFETFPVQGFGKPKYRARCAPCGSSGTSMNCRKVRRIWIGYCSPFLAQLVHPPPVSSEPGDD